MFVRVFTYSITNVAVLLVSLANPIALGNSQPNLTDLAATFLEILRSRKPLQASFLFYYITKRDKIKILSATVVALRFAKRQIAVSNEILRKNTGKCYALAYFYLYYNSSKNVCLQGHFCAEFQDSVRIFKIKIRGDDSPEAFEERFNACIISTPLPQ